MRCQRHGFLGYWRDNYKLQIAFLMTPSAAPAFPGKLPLQMLAATLISFALIWLLLHSAVHATPVNIGGRGFGFSLILLVFFGPRLWPCIAIGTAAAHLAAGLDPLIALTTGLGNGLAAGFGVALMNARQFDRSLSRLKDYLALLLYGTILAPLLSAAIGVFLPPLLGAAFPANPARAYADWWMGDSLGLLNAAPTILIWLSPTRMLPPTKRWLELGGLLLVATMVGAVVFGDWLQDVLDRSVHGFVLMGIIVWAAIAFGRHVTSLLITVFFSLALASIRFNVGMFAPDKNHATLQNIWMFIFTLSVVGMTLAIVLYQLRQAKSQLRENETNFRTLAESAAVMIWLADPAGSRTWFNRAWTEFTGRPPAQEAGDGWRAGVHPDDLDNLLATVDEATRARRPFSHEYRLLHHTGGYRLIVEQAAPRFGDDGEFLGHTGSCWDVTARRAAEQALVERERTLRAIYDNSNVAIGFVDTAGHISHANQSMAEMFGCPLNELIGSEYAAHIHPQERDVGRARMRQLLGGDIDEFNVERLYLRRDGTKFWGQLAARTMRDESGHLLGLVVVITDITDRKAADVELRLAAQVFANSHEGIMITNAENRIISVNQAFTTITGYADHEAIGQTPRLLSSGKHNRFFYSELWRQVTETGHWDGEIWNKTKSGRLYPEWLSISTVRNEKGLITNFISIFTDITERRAAEDRIRHLAQYDFLTDLPNRALLFDRLTHELASARRYNKRFAVMFLDLDKFKPVNDLYGHDVGDMLLREVAQRLKENVRDSDTVSRQGGDEFIILVTELPEAEQMVQLGQKLLHILGEPYRINGHELRVTPSIGIAVYPEDGEDIDTLTKNADTAMYRAKGAGRNNLQCYNGSLNTLVRDSLF